MLQTVFRNLTSNAIKYTQQGGCVTISAVSHQNNNVNIAVSDTGIGMSKEMVENLFNNNIIVNRLGTNGERSHGLGLLLCKEFIEKHGGSFSIKSEEGVGSEFFF